MYDARENVDTMIRRLETPPISLPASLVETIDIVCAITQAKVHKTKCKLREVTEIISVGETQDSIKQTPLSSGICIR